MAHTPPAETSAPPAPATKKDRTHWLYIAVIASVVLGAAVGLFFPEFGKSLKPLGDGFVSLIKMMIGPVIFCTIVLGVGSIAKAATVGRVGGIALVYFMAMSTFALAIGLVVGNLIHPGEGLKLTPYDPNKPQAAADGTVQFLLDIIPGSLPVLPTLFIALLVGFALQQMGPAGAPLLRGLTLIQGVVFRILMMVMWVAPIGAMALLMGAFYLTCIAFIVVVLGTVLKVVTGLSILALMKYLGREYLLIFATSSSETALPRLIAKMEHAGVDKSVVGVTVPTGYSFNLDGTAIYLTMAALFVSNAMGAEMNLGEQIGLLVFMIIASKGAAGVTGAGMATLAAGLQAHRPELLGGMGVIVGIDKFMSEARALTNFTGNAVATLLVGRWVGELDGERARRVLSGELQFDEATVAGHDGAAHDPQQSPTIAEQAYEGHPDSSLNFAMAADGDRNPAR
ncbi:cation:dicarboxylate symporter family transporter [Micrococcus luteus]|uniref:cation:dicarboxylate symporter family transporter n=1 Tax=Micrococcus TaxID=1269 RepID=UPI0005CC2DB6|nr:MULTISPECIES: cation:dicarboxylase symporter family transporter [Micrococcus]MBM4623996.1 cation:dicarboxylase symporter family transporter [Micrococcus sp. JV4]MCT1816818.1 cation:dicarboxylase symporter family transporter [Micrococcus luteus]MCV7523068.1 cation:dicarboxylase symporter family transporter [Micrococcus luteus]MCV7618362.1 cation:dicarboxylase symporter family transporter [Micrococcus luteus]MCV7642884.1 cation:dicarboxylase symporter family transporter [Micrococcus luteus]